MGENMMISIRFWMVLSSCAFGVAIFAISGCASLYNANRDQQGQTATKAAAAFKLTDTVDAEAKRFQALAALEVTAATNRFALIRATEIREIAYSNQPIESIWVKRIDDRLNTIVDANALATLSARKNTMRLRENIANEMRDAFASAAAQNAPTCDDAHASETIPAKTARAIRKQNIKNATGAYVVMRTACEAFLAASKDYDKTFAALKTGSASGKLSLAIAQRDGDKKEKAGNEAARATAKKDLGDAVAAYEAELKKVTPPGESKTLQARIASAVEKLQKDVEKIETLQSKIGREVVAQSRLEHVDKILAAVAGGEVDTSAWSPELRKSVAVAGTLPALVDEARKNLIEAGRPRLVPYVLAREHQRLVVEEGAKIDGILDRRIAISQLVVDAYTNEATALAYVKKHVHTAWHGKTLAELDKALKDNEKRMLYELLGIYFDDVPRYQSQEMVAEYQRNATFQDEALEHSKYAALMWQNLFVGISNTLADYHASGIKPAELAEFLKAAGLFYIGIGANK